MTSNENEAILRLRIIPYNARLVDARRKLNFTQVDMYLMTGIHASKIGHIETLRCIATSFEKGEIASTLNNTVEYLFPEELEMAFNAGAFRERERHLTGRQTEALTPAYTDAALERVDELYMLPEAVSEVLATLAPRERKVIELRFGIIDGIDRTLEEVGKKFNVSKEQARNYEQKALRGLRHTSRSRGLKYYIDGGSDNAITLDGGKRYKPVSPTLSSAHLESMLKIVDSYRCLPLLIRHCAKGHYPRYIDIDRMLEQKAGWSNTRYWKAHRALYRQYRTIVDGGTSDEFERFLDLFANDVLEKVFGSDNAERIL